MLKFISTTEIIIIKRKAIHMECLPDNVRKWEIVMMTGMKVATDGMMTGMKDVTGVIVTVVTGEIMIAVNAMMMIAINKILLMVK